LVVFFFSSRRRHTRSKRDWSSDVCSSDLDREIVESELLFDGTSYQMDFVDLEEKFKQGAKAFILCSPHNPVGRVWTKEELKQLEIGRASCREREWDRVARVP